MYCLHSPSWWQSHWNKTEIVDVELADSMPDGWQVGSEWQVVVAPKNLVEISAVESDAGNYLGYVGSLSKAARCEAGWDYLQSIPTNYIAQPLLRSGETRTIR